MAASQSDTALVSYYLFFDGLRQDRKLLKKILIDARQIKEIYGIADRRNRPYISTTGITRKKVPKAMAAILLRVLLLMSMTMRLKA